MSETTPLQSRTDKILSHSTPITTALTLVICGGAFWVGRTTEYLQAQITQERSVRELENKNFTKWQEQTQIILGKLTDITNDNKRRLEKNNDK